jgi:hypothetical protein
LPEQESQGLPEVMSKRIHPPPRLESVIGPTAIRSSFEPLAQAMTDRVEGGAEPEGGCTPAANPGTLRGEQGFHIGAKHVTNISRKQVKQRAIHPGTHDSSRFQQLPHAAIADQRLEPASLRARHALTLRSQLEIAAPWIVPFLPLVPFGPAPTAGLFDESFSEQTSKRAVEVAGQQHFAAKPGLDVAHETPPVAGLIGQGQQDFEDQRFQRHHC